MKIIGKGNKGNFIVEITMEDFFTIIGAKENLSHKILEDITAIGKEFPISKFYRKSLNINKMMLNNGSYASVRNQLTKMLELLTPIEELISVTDKLLNDE